MTDGKPHDCGGQGGSKKCQTHGSLLQVERSRLTRIINDF
jgi:hypothetical protein